MNNITIKNKEIVFEEKYIDKEYGTTTLYFIAPKEMLKGKYPEAESTEISIEFPTGQMESKNASVMFSPTKDGEDYDWYDVDLPYDVIDRLINLALLSEENIEKYIQNQG